MPFIGLGPTIDEYMCFMMALHRRIRFLMLVVLLPVLLASWRTDAESANKPLTVSVTIPSGTWKAVRLRNLPRETVVAVALRCDGSLTVGLVNAPDHARFPDVANPLFLGQAESKLGFSATIPQPGDYFVVLDNRNGTGPRRITMTTTARLGGEAAKNLIASQLKKVEAQLKVLELKLNQAFVFTPIPIRVASCKQTTPFERHHSPDELTLCLQYARHLMETFRDRTQASDALIYSMFHEMAHLFQQQWNLVPGNPEASLDELTTVLMLTFRLDANVRAYAQMLINQPSLASSLEEVFHDPLHPLTAERAERVLAWATDPDLVRAWQPQLIPHMQTKMLQQLKDHPQPWSAPGLIDEELRKRTDEQPARPERGKSKGHIKA